MRRNCYLYPLSVILLSLFIVFNSCDFNLLRKIKYNRLYHQYNQKLEYRDSLYIMYTVKRWMDSISPCFQELADSSLSLNQIQISIGGTFYSPDKKRIIVWIIDKVPKCRYSGQPIVGIRNDTNKVWQLYPLALYSVSCYPLKKDVITSLSSYYFGAMKNSCVGYVNLKNIDTLRYGGKVRWDLERQSKNLGLYNPDYSNYVLQNFGYNIQDKGFWSKSLIWEKGARVKGYYLFQLAGNGASKSANAPIDMPKINYPDSILRLYPATARILSCGKSLEKAVPICYKHRKNLNPLPASPKGR